MIEQLMICKNPFKISFFHLAYDTQQKASLLKKNRPSRTVIKYEVLTSCAGDNQDGLQVSVPLAVCCKTSINRFDIYSDITKNNTLTTCYQFQVIF